MKNLSKEELINYFLTNNVNGRKTNEKHLNKVFPNLINEINDFIEKSEYDISIHFTQKLYNYLYNINKIQKCNNCGCQIKWNNRFTEGYRKTCSYKCSFNSSEVKEKSKQTNLEKYGSECYSGTDEYKEKIRQINLNKYGVEHIFQAEEVKEKMKQTNLEKYGNESYSKTEEFKEKRLETNMERYGVSTASKLDITKEKMKQTNLERYGVSCTMLVDEFKNKCANSRRNNTIQKYITHFNNPNIIISTHKKNEFLIENYCKIHNKFIINRNILNQRVFGYKLENICTICNPVGSFNSSGREKDLKNFIENNINSILNKLIILKKEFDIYIPNYNLAIEFNGLYWHSDRFLSKSYHLEKTILCEENNIQLLHIFEDEWIFKQEIIKSLILEKLDIYSDIINLDDDNYNILEVDNDISSKFLDNNHIQGNTNLNIKLGLFYNNELVSVMCLNKLNDNEYEILRYCNKLNINVINGFKHLIDYFNNNYNPNNIIFYADRRYYNNSNYEKLGFKLITYTEPKYYYVNNSQTKKYNNIEIHKDQLINKDIFENQIEPLTTYEKKFLKIYDCGDIKFEMRF